MSTELEVNMGWPCRPPLGTEVNAPGGAHGTALQAAAAKGHLIVMDIVLEAGADVDGTSSRYPSALYAAASRDQVEAIRFLAQNGANINPTSTTSCGVKSLKRGSLRSTV